MDSVGDLRSRLRAFAEARDWQQFHTPKNLAMALGGEVGELVAELQWLDDAAVNEGWRARGCGSGCQTRLRTCCCTSSG